jgi:hypothetical protein
MTPPFHKLLEANIREIIPRRGNDVYVITLSGFGHNSGTDLPLLDRRVRRNPDA